MVDRGFTSLEPINPYLPQHPAQRIIISEPKTLAAVDITFQNVKIV